MIVTGFDTKDWDKGTEGIVKVTSIRLDDGREIPGYDIPVDKLETGKPLPEGWEVATAKSGKFYMKVPKRGGGKGFGGGNSYYNSAEGVAFTQERMDRRTALMQAVEAVKPGHEAATYLEWAEPFYQWLRSSVPAGGGVVLATPPLYPPVGASSSKADIKWAEKISPPVAEETDGGEGTAYGEGVVSLPLPDPNHEHQWVDSPKLTKYQVCAIPNCYETKRKP